MPNRQGARTPTRAVRISDETWERAKLAAERNGEERTAVIVAALDAYWKETMGRMTLEEQAGMLAQLDQRLAAIPASA